MRWIALIGVLLASMIISIGWLGSAARCLAAVLLVFFLPGFLILRALLPQKPVAFAFILMSIGTSAAITIVSALVLNFAHALNPIGWTAWLGSVSLIAFWQGMRSKAARPSVVMPWPRPNAEQLACLSIVVLLALSAVAVARYGALHHRQFAYTELWMLPSDGHNISRVTIGVKNEEQKLTGYDLEILVNDQIVMRWPHFYLKENEARIEQIPIRFDPGLNQLLEAKSYTAKRGELSRAELTRAEANRADQGVAPCDPTADQPAQARPFATRAERTQNPCDQAAEQKPEPKPYMNRAAGACDSPTDPRAELRFYGTRSDRTPTACDQPGNQRAGIFRVTNRADRTPAGCNQTGDRLPPGCERAANQKGDARLAMNRAQRMPLPCDQTADLRNDPRPALKRAERMSVGCDQATDQRVEARLYKDGNLAFLYRDVWLGQPTMEVR